MTGRASIRVRLATASLVLGSAGGLLLTGCGDSGTEAAPAATMESVTFHADYPSYDSIEQLDAASDLVAEVRITENSRTVLLTPEEPTDPNDPQSNPTLGVDSPAPAPAKAPPIVITVRTAEIINVISGDGQAGQIIEVQELGGVYGGKKYAPEHGVGMAPGENYVMFLSAGDGSGPNALLNPDEAKYPEAADGTFEPLPTNQSPITADEVQEYVEESAPPNS